MSSPNFFAELKRRNVIRLAGLYLVGAWLVVQVAGTVLPMFGTPEWLPRTIVILLAIGFIPALIFSWVFELTPEGLKREGDVAPGQSITPQTARRMDRMIIVVLLLALGYFAFDKFVLAPRREAALLARAVPNESKSAMAAKSIAVLPFKNLSKDEENAFFADGVQDEILTHLAHVADLKVISHTSVMQYKNVAQRNMRQIGQELGVAHLLEGSVQRTTDRVRVIAQLIEARSDAHLWAQTYDRDLADIFAIQSEIAKAIADQLQAKLSPSETAAIAARPTQNTEAYDLFLRGKQLVHEHAPRLEDPRFDQSFSEAVNLLEKAVALDPNFALAHCLLVEANLSLYWHAQARPGTRERAQVALDAARRLAPQAGETYLAEALFFYWGQRDYDRALESLEKAARVSPNNADVFRLSARVERRLNRWPEAIRHGLRAVELDPRGWEPRDELISTYTIDRQYGSAELQADRAIAEFPDRADHFRALKMDAALARGDLKTARATIATLSVPDSTWQIFTTAYWERNYEETQRLLNLWADRPPSDITLYPASFLEAMMARAAGDSGKARAAFTAARQHFSELLRDRGDEEPALLSQLAIVDAGLGHKEEALNNARRALELLPPSKDSLGSAVLQKNLALVYCWTGERDRALDELAAAVKMPDVPTYGELTFDPSWDSLRGDPRFEKIVASLAPK